MSAEEGEVGENVSLSGSAVCPDEGRFPTLAELQVGLGSGGKKRISRNIPLTSTSSFRKLSSSHLRHSGADPQRCHVLHTFGKIYQKHSAFPGLQCKNVQCSVWCNYFVLKRFPTRAGWHLCSRWHPSSSPWWSTCPSLPSSWWPPSGCTRPWWSAGS